MSPRLTKLKKGAHPTCRYYDHASCTGTVLVGDVWRGVQGLRSCGCYCHKEVERDVLRR